MFQQLILKNTLLSFALVLAGTLSLFVGTVSAQLETKKNLCGGANLTLSGSDPAQNDQTGYNQGCNNPVGGAGNPEKKLNDTIAQIVNILSVIVGIVAVIMIIIGGFRYVTSGGDSGNVTAAKNTVIYAIVGLVVVALAQIIVRFVINKVAPS